MKLSFLILALGLTACGKGSKPVGEVCTEYAGAFQIEYPDHSIKKSSVSICDGLYKATAVDQSQSTSANPLYVQLRDTSGLFYITEFTPAIGDICVTNPSRCSSYP